MASAGANRRSRPKRRWATRPERSLGEVPGWIRVGVVAALLAQIALHSAFSSSRAAPTAEELPPVVAPSALRIAALGDGVLASRLVMLWLQVFDNQPGISIPFRELDYAKVRGWLSVASALDDRSAYPLLSASRLYALVADRERTVVMLDFVFDKFMEAPNARWRWLAEASLIAKHRLKDLPLALKYAKAISEHATDPSVPYWAKDMTLILLAEMGEYDAARGFIGALLESGEITDPHEIKFLTGRLRELAPDN